MYNDFVKITKPYNNEIFVIENFASKQEVSIVAEYAESKFIAAEKKDPSLERVDLKKRANLVMKSLELRAIDFVNDSLCLPERVYYTGMMAPFRLVNKEFPSHYDDAGRVDNNPVLYGMTLYLTDNFDGGELVYENLNISYKPVAGELVLHPATEKYRHRVNAPIGGSRIGLPMFVSEITED